MKHPCILAIAIFVTIVTSCNNPIKEVLIIPEPNSIEIIGKTYDLPQSFMVYTNSKELAKYADFIAAGCEISDSRDAEVKLLFEDINNHKENDESYRLTIDKKGITITAANRAGILYGIQTLNQLLFQTQENQSFELQYITISDSPAYEWRSFMLDASRHFQPVETVKQVLDYMLCMKLNVFHWHLTDDQGWRIEIEKYPELNKVGSFLASETERERNGFYTKEEIKEILAYARERNIMIIPEFDIPSHSRSAILSYPELGCPNNENARVFCAGNPKTYTFLKDVFMEIATLFETKYVHIGGDERDAGVWEACELCQAKMKKLGIDNESNLQNKMLDEICEHLLDNGIKTIAWAENLEGGIPEGQITQAWRLKDETQKAVDQEHFVINSYHVGNYLDYPANKEEKHLFLDWMPVLTMEKIYNFKIIPEGITKEQEKLIIGSECPLWTEAIYKDSIYKQIHGRLEAHAEKVWTNEQQKSYIRFEKNYNYLEGYFEGVYFK